MNRVLGLGNLKYLLDKGLKKVREFRFLALIVSLKNVLVYFVKNVFSRKTISDLSIIFLQAEKIEKLIKAAKVEIEPFWPGLFAKALEGHSLDSLIQSAGAPGAGGAAPAAGGAAASGGEAEAKEEEKKEEKKEEEEEESDDDMGFGELLNLVQFCTK